MGAFCRGLVETGDETEMRIMRDLDLTQTQDDFPDESHRRFLHGRLDEQSIHTNIYNLSNWTDKYDNESI